MEQAEDHLYRLDEQWVKISGNPAFLEKYLARTVQLFQISCENYEGLYILTTSLKYTIARSGT
jgi:hypothetical protein